MKTFLIKFTDEYGTERHAHVQGSIENAQATAENLDKRYGDYGTVIVHEVNFVQSWEYDRWDNPKMRGI